MFLLYWIFDDQKSLPRKINTVNPLYFIIDKINVYIEEDNGNTYLTLVPTDESKDMPKAYEELEQS